MLPRELLRDLVLIAGRAVRSDHDAEVLGEARLIARLEGGRAWAATRATPHHTVDAEHEHNEHASTTTNDRATTTSEGATT